MRKSKSDGQEDHSVSRREFLTRASLVSAAGALGTLPFSQQAAAEKIEAAETGPFTETSEVYETIGEAIKRHVAERPPVATPDDAPVGLAINLTGPHAPVSLQLGNKATEVEFGRRSIAESSVTLSTAVAHKLLTGEMTLAQATASEQLTLSGDRRVLANIASFPIAVRPHYYDALRRAKRADLTRGWKRTEA